MAMDGGPQPWQDQPAPAMGVDHPMFQAAQAATAQRIELGRSIMNAQADTWREAAVGPKLDASQINHSDAKLNDAEKLGISQNANKVVEDLNAAGHFVPHDAQGDMGWGARAELGKPGGTGVISEGQGRMATEAEIAAQRGPEEVHAETPAVRPAFTGAGRGKIPQAVIDAAQATQDKYGVPKSVSVAQWALESGYGKKMPQGSNNPFGIKATAGQEFVEAATHEMKNGKLEPTVGKFAKYNDLTEAFEAHAKLLSSKPAYKQAMKDNWNDVVFAKDISKKYATNKNYASLLLRVMQSQRKYLNG